MKITNEDYKVLETAINRVHHTSIQKGYKAGGLSDTSYKWECYHHAVKIHEDQPEIYKTLRGLYNYLNDDNIETALNKIIKPI